MMLFFSLFWENPEAGVAVFQQVGRKSVGVERKTSHIRMAIRFPIVSGLVLRMASIVQKGALSSSVIIFFASIMKGILSSSSSG